MVILTTTPPSGALAPKKYRTICADVARGNELVAKLRYERDISAGVVEALIQSSWRHAADRRDLGQLIGWAERQAHIDGPEPEQPTVHGRRAA